MSDTLKTVLNGIPSFLWKDGEQPDATKFSTLFGSFSSAFNVISNIIGPAVNNSVSVSTLDTNVSAGKYYKDMSGADRTSFLSTLNATILSTFNVARVIGPHAALNPQYLPGSSHTKASLGSGYPLATGTKVQQLPFPPSPSYTWEIVDGDGDSWSKASSKENLLTRLEDKFFFLDADGVLYSNQLFPGNSYIKYDLYIPNTYSYLGAGYNCIPDLSILSLSAPDRLCLEVSFDSSSGAYSRWLVKLPEIISVRDPLLTTSTKEISSNSYEPVGEYSASLEKRFYTLNTDIYPNSGSPSVIDGNLLALYDFENQQTYVIDGWEVATGEDDDVIRSYFFTGPKSLEQIFRNDASGLLASGGFSTRNFFLFCLGSNISQQLAQVSLNFSKHKHNGHDSYRVSHRDLLDSENNKQGIGSQNGASGGLDFIAYNRQLALSESQDNVHAQYMNRLGFLFGGSHGKYEGIASFDKLVDLNAMHGDLLFYPIENVSSPYKYADGLAYVLANGNGDTTEKITWDLDGTPSTEVNSSFPDYRTHATIFGWPNLITSESYTQGATKLYYEPWNFLAETEWDNTGNEWSLSRHGLVPGNLTGLTGNAKRRGLSINWGNLFFGYREDIFGGLLTGSGEKTEASASFRTSEFNIVTTANGEAGKNTNSSLKNGYTYRDGFSVKALKGSNIWLSVGGDGEQGDALSSLGNPGSFALDVSLRGSSNESLTNPQGIRAGVGYENRAAGAGILATPILRSNGKIPWVDSSNADQTIASLWNSTQISSATTDPYIENSVLDIFNLAVDYQQQNTRAESIAYGVDDSMLSWTAGRPFIRGTYGINFCVSNSFANLNETFKTGFHLRYDDNDPWGPSQAVLRDGSEEYIHREFKFWGSNTEIDPDPDDPSLNNTVGGNINLLYNFGRDYYRFGIYRNWNSNEGSLSGGINIYSPWSNSREIALGSSAPENYGSAIRQASYIDAFAGLRNDPLQPYMAEYVLPFRAKYSFGKLTSWDSTPFSIDDLIKRMTFIIGQKVGATSGSSPPALLSAATVLYDQAPYYPMMETYYEFNDITLDGLIKGSEEILIANSDDIFPGLTHLRFPSCLVDYNVKLTYFMGKRTASGSSASGQQDSPHITPDEYYGKIMNGDAVMVPAYMSSMGGVDNDYIKVPIVMTDRNNKYDIESYYNRNSIISYNTSIGVWPAVNSAASWNANFPTYYNRYASSMSNKMFVLLLTIDDRTDEITGYNSPVPYRVFVEDDELKMEVIGSINFKMMTSYHREV